MRVLRVLALVLFTGLVLALPALAQPEKQPAEEVEVTAKTASDAIAETRGFFILSGQSLGAGLGAALTIIGAGFGFGKIGSAALEGMARQPEVAARIQTGMIIIAALLEGATFFALIVCILITLGIGGTPL